MLRSSNQFSFLYQAFIHGVRKRLIGNQARKRQQAANCAEFFEDRVMLSSTAYAPAMHIPSVGDTAPGATVINTTQDADELEGQTGQQATVQTSALHPTFMEEVSPGIFVQRTTIDASVAPTISNELADLYASNLNGNGLQFNFIPAVGMPQNAIDGFAAAGALWSSILTDDIIININIDFRALGPGILGSASSTTESMTITNFRNALLGDVTSLTDMSATANLPTGSTFSIYTSDPINGSPGNPIVDNNGSSNNTFLDINTTASKAIGVRAADSVTVDANISFSNLFTWDFDRSNGITGGAFDFIGVAAHEIGHALGFRSGVDTVDATTGAGGSAGVSLENFRVSTALDIFRYSTASIANGTDIDMRADTAVKFFSIDGGTTNLATFSQGRANGDGQQASHWKDNLGIGIMDPTASNGEYADITDLDVLAMDAIGWDVRMDFGDGPNNTTLADNGPRHILFAQGGPSQVNILGTQSGPPKVFLGAGVTTDFDGQPNATAAADTDDGVTIPALTRDQIVAVDVVSSAGGGVLNYFVDFNQNGNFTDAGESFTATLSGGAESVNITVPVGATLGNTIARFRISTAGGLSSVGPAADGEVEDYQVTINDVPPPVDTLDFGDAPATYGTLLADNGARHEVGPLYLGNGVDAEADGQPSVLADADGADENGIILFSLIRPGYTVGFQALSLGAGELAWWMDFDASGTFDNATERFSATLVAGFNFLTFDVPATAVVGDTYLRFRLASAAADVANPTGLAADGEVEDYIVTIEPLVDDPDDQISEATPIMVGPANSGEINPEDDVNMYSFTAAANETLLFDIDTFGSSVDSVIRLFDGAGNELAINDDGEEEGPPPEDGAFDSFIRYTFATPGTYYIGVSSFGNSDYDPLTGQDFSAFIDEVGTYELTITSEVLDIRNFDFGTPTSPVEMDSTQVRPGDVYSIGQGFGWVTPLNESFNTGSGGPVQQDYNFFRSGSRTFLVDLPDGEYDVEVTIGSSLHRTVREAVALNGIEVDLVSTSPGQFHVETYRVMVTGGQLSLTLETRSSDIAIINGLSIRPVMAPVNLPPTEVLLQNSIVELREDVDTTGRIKVADIVIIDDGLGVNDIYLTGDDAALFEVIGTELFLIAGATLDSVANPVLDVTVNVDDTVVGLTPDATAAISINVTPASVIDPIMRFDFGFPGIALQDGFTGVAATDAYTVERGFGWESTTNIETFNTGAGPVDQIQQDYHFFRSGSRTFLVDLPDGEYLVTVGIGSQIHRTEREAIILNGTEVDLVTTEPGVFNIESYYVIVSGGQLSLTLETRSGQIAIINGLLITPADLVPA